MGDGCGVLIVSHSTASSSSCTSHIDFTASKPLVAAFSLPDY